MINVLSYGDTFIIYAVEFHKSLDKTPDVAVSMIFTTFECIGINCYLI